MKIIIENTLYSLFLYLLIDKEWNTNLYIFNEELRNLLGIKVKKFNYILYKLYRRKESPFLFYCQKIKFLFLFFKLGLYSRKDIELYGDINMINNFLLNQSFYILEDGNATYKIKERNSSFFSKLKKLIKLENIFFDESQTSKFVKKIYMTGIAPIPEEIKDKVEIINIKELWNKKTEEEKREILDVFNFDKNILGTIKDKKTILFTQPISEDNFVREEEKIDLYKKVLKNYDLKDLIIKTHPREKTDYRKYFLEALILDNVFPSEFFMLFDVKFDKAITLFSTAVLNLKDVKEIDFYGTEVHPKLLEFFGSLDNIYKRNKFLNENDNNE